MTAPEPKVHWIRERPEWTHGAYYEGKRGTRDPRRATCVHCRWKAGLEPDLYEGRRAAPTMEPLGVCARRQVLAMVLGLA